jgi:hypothetical protein
MARNRGRRPAGQPESTSAAPPAPAGAGDAGEFATPPADRSGQPADAGQPGTPRNDPERASEPGTFPGAARTAAPESAAEESGSAGRQNASSGAAGDRPATGGQGAPPGAGAPGMPGAAGARPRPPSGVVEPAARSRPTAATPRPAAGAHRGFRNGLIGGLLGGLIGGVAVWLALTYLVAPKTGAELQALQDRVGQLDGSVQKLQADDQALAQLGNRVQSLEQAAAASSEQSRSSPALAALQKRVDSLESQVAGLATDVAGAGDARTGDVATLDALQSRLSALENQLSQAGAGRPVAERIGTLARRVDALEPAAAKLDQLAGSVQQAAQQSAAAGNRLNGLATEVQGLDQRTQSLHGDLQDLQGRLAALQNRAVSAADRRQLAAALALITTQIETAIDRAQPYQAPLHSLQALAGRDQVVQQAAAELAPSAASGVPTLAELRQAFVPVAGEIVQRAQAPEGGGLLDQAASNLMRLVTVRPVGAKVEGDDAAARVARAEADLGQGDLAGAVAELQALKGPAAEAAADWLAKAEPRLRASEATARLQAHATELLTQTTD